MIKSKDTLFPRNYTLNCKGRMIDLSTPIIMGIINITPDSFYDGGKIKNDKDLLHKVEKHLNEGAKIIDIGAFSSRPGAESIDEKTELKKLDMVCSIIKNEHPESLLSVDTYRSSVAVQVINQGCDIINDISGSSMDEKLLSICGEYKIPYICMHSNENPFDHQNIPKYESVTYEVLNYFKEKIDLIIQSGVTDVIIDPGFGFAKSMRDNFKLLKEMNSLKTLDKPILVGVSRKRMIYKTLNITAQEALNGSTAIHSLALINGGNILRVHDVKEAKEVVDLHIAYKKA